MKREDKVLIGKITSASGLRGEVRIYCYAARKERFAELEEVFLGDEARRVDGCRYQKNMVILKLEGVDSRDQAERLRGAEVFMAASDLPALEPGEYYIRDLLGARVVREDGSPVGSLKDVLTDRPQDLFVVARPAGGDLLIPNLPVFIRDIDPREGLITVSLIEGMEEL